MLKKYAQSFYRLGDAMGVMHVLVSNRFTLELEDNQFNEPEHAHVRQVITVDTALFYIKGRMAVLKECCVDLDLSFSLKELNRWELSLLNADRKQPSLAEISAAVNAFDDRVRDELEERHLMFIAPDHAHLYESPLEFWGDVPTKFSSTIYDIEEASNTAVS